LRGGPSGLLVSKTKFPVNPTTSLTVSAKSRIVTV
jgi:hypothetical protein